MKTLEKGQEKIKKICDLLREESLEPAKREGERMISEAQRQANEMIAHAENEAKKIISDAKKEIDQEKSAFEASLILSSKQALEALRSEIEKKFFNDSLSNIIIKNSTNPKIISELLSAIVQAVQKEGLAANLSAVVPKSVAPREVNELILAEILETLKDKSVQIGNFQGGVQVKLQNKNLTIDVSERALKELLSTYLVRKDFRKMIFAEEGER